MYLIKKISSTGLLAACVMLGSSGKLQAQVIWTEGAGNPNWSDTGNWNTGILPGAASAVQIGNSTIGIVGVDIGSDVTIGSLTFNNTLGMTTQVLSLGEMMKVNGAIVNNSSYQQQIGLTLNAGATATYSGGSAGLLFSKLNINTKTIGTNGVVAATGGTLIFDINSSIVYGSIGTITAAGSTIVIAGTYTGNVSDVFQLVGSGSNVSGVTFDFSQITLTPGQTWDTSKFAALGQLSVVPEPATTSLLLLGSWALFLLRRRRRN